MKHLYLLINFLTIVFPVLLSFDKRVRFYKSWKHLLPALFINGLVFLFWDYLFTIYKVWSFNPRYVLGIYFLNLPLEEILFFLTVPFSCVFIYECLNHYIKMDVLRRATQSISVLLVALALVMLIIYHDRVYTLITFGLLLVVVIYATAMHQKILNKFYLTYCVSLIPFYIVNGLLTSYPVVLYNNSENIGLRVGTIPFEDHFYSMAMLLMNILLFEYFRNRAQKIMV